VLPLTLENATSITQAFLHSGKEYVCLMQLHGEVEKGRLEAVMKEFTGEIIQRPPLRSSVKRDPRVRTIYEIELLEHEARRVLFRVACQAGTYVRKLCSDIGEVLGVGAHMQELRRTRAGPFTEDTAHILHEVVDAWALLKEGDEKPMRQIVRPMEEALEFIPKIKIRDSAVDAICHGADLAIPGVLSLSRGITPGSTVAILTIKGEAIALGRALLSTEQILEQEKGLAAKTVRVMMQRGTYPPMWKK
jgi:H/ACA ribonucleoprotein complex subunit 4